MWSAGKGRGALEQFNQMQQEGVQPFAVTFTGVLNAFASVVALEVGRHICESDVFVCSSFIDMYAKMWEHRGCLECAQ
jgi:hypothetical protein